MPEKPLFALTDLASVLEVTPKTIQNMVKTGRVPAPDVVLSHKVKRWSRELVLRWLESVRSVQSSAS